MGNRMTVFNKVLGVVKKRRVYISLIVLILIAAVVSVMVGSQKNNTKDAASHKTVVIKHLAQATTEPKSTSLAPAAPRVLFSDPLNGPDRIVTNEYVHFSNAGCPYTSSDWDMTSGTLLIKNNAGYSGVPTVEKSSQCDSTVHNNSAIFRLNTKEDDFKNIKVSMDYMPVAHGGGGAPDNSYDGIHIWVGYQSEYALYAATIFRWDNEVVIKKKVPAAQAQCTDVSNDGCYFNVSKTVQNPEAAKVWHHVDVTDTVDSQGVVHIATSIDGKLVATGVDDSVGGAPYPVGAVGVRGDNTEFYFKNFTVTQL
jgi:hypothetical protein